MVYLTHVPVWINTLLVAKPFTPLLTLPSKKAATSSIFLKYKLHYLHLKYPVNQQPVFAQ